MSRVKYKKTCADCEGREVKQEDIVKGFEYEDGKYVIFEESDFEKIKSKKDKNITIEKFVNLSEVDPLYFDKPYYVAPTGAEKAFAVLLTAMEQEGKAAIAKTVLGTKETLILIRAKDGQMLLNTLFFEEEVTKNPAKEITEKGNAAELKMAKAIIEGMTGEFNPEEYKDEYRQKVQEAMGDKFRISLAAKKNPVQFVAYDILYFDGKDLTDKPLMERKAALSKAVTEGHNLSVSRWIEKNGVAFFELAKKENLEGIVAKKKDGLYHIGKRTSEWIKIKVMQDEDLLVLGYQPDEDGKVKDLILGYYDESGVLQCRGKVYLGVSKAEQNIIADFAKKNTVAKPWFDKYKNVVWLKPQLMGTAHFMHETESGGMRQPVWKGLRDDI